MAFDWDHPKADHLATVQAQGLAVAADRDNVRCGEISRIQEAYLVDGRVDPRRVTRLTQPLDGACTSTPLPASVDEALSGRSGRGLVAITAVSRLDHFKNVELFVRGAVEGLRDGHLEKAIVIGGFPHDDERERLKALVPFAEQCSFAFVPRIPRAALVGTVFPRLASHGVFVCSSRFDLVPYAALEAARSGLCTVVPDTGCVGAAEYLPPRYLFAATPHGLAELFATLAGDDDSLHGFVDTADSIRLGTSGNAFRGSFQHLCSTL
jgi:glycosyltransferase involved in cell wall biosynthesis